MSYIVEWRDGDYTEFLEYEDLADALAKADQIPGAIVFPASES